MDEQAGWKLVGKKLKNKNKKFSKNIIIEENNTDDITSIIKVQEKNDIKQEIDISHHSNLQDKEIVIDTGDNILLTYSYILWCHDIFNKDWNLNSYIKLCSISNVSQFWKLFNNLDKLGYKINNFFLMKTDTDPLWEHENNRNGGICSLRSDIETSLRIYEDLCSHMLCNSLTKEMNDINGISISPKNNWAIIKIWNKDKHNDLSKTLNPIILNKYKDYSIKYKENEPEY